ncbi:MAG: Ycf34 family protein [Cyanobacteriota bacterium]|nr:Ycf34 family protein [Cyanobacteriota bacterium]
MCICVDCHWIDRCQAYHAVERRHGVPHLTLQPSFSPEGPQVHVQIRELANGEVGIEWDVRACESFTSDPGHWRRLRPNQAVPA